VSRRTVANFARYVTRKQVILSLTLTLSCISAASGQCSDPSFDAILNIQAGGPPPSGNAAYGDVNGDGKIDVIVPNTGADTISVLLGGTAKPTTILINSVTRPIAVGIGDFNHDGKADLAVSHGSFSTTIAILIGNGAGNFGSPTDFAANLSQPLIVADFNNDGNPDVFLGNSSTNNSQMFLGNANGTLAAGFFVVVGNNTHAVAVDLNQDGKLDLATESDGTNFASVALGDGTGHFSAPNTFPITAPQFGNIAAGDLNKDGKIDLVVAGQSNGFQYLLGNGSGGFGPATSVNTGFSTFAASIADFNGDGNNDIATAGGTTATLVLGNGSGTFSATKNYLLSDSASNVLAADFNSDSKVDVLIINASSAQNSASLLSGDGAGNLLTPIILTASSAFSVVDGDWNNDGKRDLAVANISQNNVSVFLANGGGSFQPAINFAAGNQPRSITSGDLNNDQNPDLVIANFNSNNVSILFGNGAGGFAPATNINVPGFGAEYVAIADYNGDGIQDLAVGYLNSSFISILLGNGAGGFTAASNFTVPNGVQQIALGDFNSDGKIDLALATIPGLAVLLGNGNGQFGAANLLSTTATTTSVAVGDFNGDGVADLATSVTNNSQVRIYAGTGTGTFGAPAVFAASGPMSVAVGDFNGDGNDDVAAAGAGRTSVLLGNGAGGLAAAVEYANGGILARFIVAADLNGDGRTDLALANQGSAIANQSSGTVSILTNKCQATPPAVPAFSIDDVSITEGDTGTLSANLHVSLSAMATRNVSVSFYTAATKDATKDGDYQDVTGRITFVPGNTDQTVTVPIIGDLIDEPDEQFGVVLALPLNATLNKSRAVATILDNDPPPAVSVSDATLSEGDSGATLLQFPVTLSIASGKTISINYATADVTAIAGSDYVATSGTVTFPAGTTSKSITVTLNGDTTIEPDETFVVRLTNPVNASLAASEATGTILDDDGSIKLVLDTSGPAADQAAALDALLLVRDPFHVRSIADWWNLGSDRNTRVTVFVANLSLNTGETASAVTVNLVDSGNQSRDVVAEAVRAVPNSFFTQITFRIPDNLPPGSCLLTIKAHGRTSNTGSIYISP
jgi:hypothetical protein